MSDKRQVATDALDTRLRNLEYVLRIIAPRHGLYLHEHNGRLLLTEAVLDRRYYRASLPGCTPFTWARGYVDADLLLRARNEDVVDAIDASLASVASCLRPITVIVDRDTGDEDRGRP